MPGLSCASYIIDSKNLFVAIGNPSFGEVIRRQLHCYLIAFQDLDEVHPHLTGDVCQDLVPVLQSYAEGCVRQCLCNRPIDLDRSLFCHSVLLVIRGFKNCVISAKNRKNPELSGYHGERTRATNALA